MSNEFLNRKIYFKLPLAQTQFHWLFDSREDFLAGRLVISIKRKEGSDWITIFENGALSEDWTEIKGLKHQTGSQIYFGFVSERRYSVSNNDVVEIFLHVKKDLSGIGPDNKGVLLAGQYKTESKFTIYDHNDETIYTGDENCDPMWNLKITDKKGWHTPKPIAPVKLSPLSEEVIRQAEQEAMWHHHEFIGNEHLLLGLFGPKNDGRVVARLTKEGVNVLEVRKAIGLLKGKAKKQPSQPMSLTPRAQKGLAVAQELAEKEGSELVDPEHILQALVLDTEGVAARVLRNAK